MSTPPVHTAPGITRAEIKTALEVAITTQLTSWKVSRGSFDDFPEADTDHMVPLSFVVGIDRSVFQSGAQRTGGTDDKRSAYVATPIRIKLATRSRAGSSKADATKHEQWVGAVLRAAITAGGDGFRLIYRQTSPATSYSSGQVLVTEHQVECRHLLPLE